MEDNRSFVLPSDSEKLSHKFILDSLRRRAREEAALAPTPSEETPTELALEPIAAEPPATQDSIGLEPLSLPADKAYFRIGEVSELLGVEAHVLRYWEGEFPSVRPEKSGGQRVYRRKDVETLNLIRHLLHVEKFSIKGAKRKILDRSRHPEGDAKTSGTHDETCLKELSTGLRELIRLAQGNAGW